MSLEGALCKGIPIEIFFPVKGNNSSASVIRQYCAKCPVRLECLDLCKSGDFLEGTHGIYGGLTPRQRRILESKYPDKTCLCKTELRCYVHD